VIESQGRRIIVDTCVGNDKRINLPAWNKRQGPRIIPRSAPTPSGAPASTPTAPSPSRRGDFLARYADRPVLVIGTHFATPSAGRIVRDGDAYRFAI